uniref:MATH domain-containing protein n=2 Tax=Aegilops tauschii TaxID=37682 RepID=A0A453SYE7_AEGTS
SRASGACVFQIKDYTDIKRILGAGQDTTSDDFYVGDYRFRILCCPNGSSEMYEGYVSVFLEYLSVRDINPISKVQMSILPGKYSKSTFSLTREEYRFKKCGDTWGWNDFISHEKLQGDPEPKQIGSKKPSKDTSADWWTNFIVRFQDGLEACR